MLSRPQPGRGFTKRASHGHAHTQQKVRNPGSEAPLLESHHMGLELGILGTRRSSRQRAHASLLWSYLSDCAKRFLIMHERMWNTKAINTPLRPLTPGSPSRSGRKGMMQEHMLEFPNAFWSSFRRRLHITRVTLYNFVLRFLRYVGFLREGCMSA